MGGMISLLSLDIVYSTYRKNILGAIKSRLNYLFQRLKTEKIAVSNRKKAERSDLADANQLRLIRLSCGFIFYKFYPLGIYKCTNNEFEFLKLQNMQQIEKKKTDFLINRNNYFPKRCKNNLRNWTPAKKCRLETHFFLFHLFLFRIFLLAK